MVIKKSPYGHDDDEIKKTPEKKNKGVIHQVITENETEIHQDALDRVI